MNELLQIQEEDFENLPVEQQAEFLDMLAACLPTEKLIQLGELG